MDEDQGVISGVAAAVRRGWMLARADVQRRVALRVERMCVCLCLKEATRWMLRGSLKQQEGGGAPLEPGPEGEGMSKTAGTDAAAAAAVDPCNGVSNPCSRAVEACTGALAGCGDSGSGDGGTPVPVETQPKTASLSALLQIACQ